MKSTFFLLLCTIALVSSTAAQNPHLNYKLGLKLYNRSSYHKTTRNLPGQARISDREYQILHPTAAIQWRSSTGNFHEVELTDFKLNTTETISTGMHTGGYPALSERSTSRISARYEYIAHFTKSKESKLVPALGFAANPYFHRELISPVVSFMYVSLHHSAGLRAFVVPRLNYHFNNRLFADLNIPVCVADMDFSSNNERNPNLPFREQTVSELSFNMLPRYFSARIGIGVKI